MLAINILPIVGAGLLLADSALAGPVANEVRSLELTGSPVRELFPDGNYDEDLLKRECTWIQEKYDRRAEHEKAIAGRRPRQAKRGVATVDLVSFPQSVVSRLNLSGRPSAPRRRSSSNRELICIRHSRSSSEVSQSVLLLKLSPSFSILVGRTFVAPRDRRADLPRIRICRPLDVDSVHRKVPCGPLRYLQVFYLQGHWRSDWIDVYVVAELS